MLLMPTLPLASTVSAGVACPWMPRATLLKELESATCVYVTNASLEAKWFFPNVMDLAVLFAITVSNTEIRVVASGSFEPTNSLDARMFPFTSRLHVGLDVNIPMLHVDASNVIIVGVT
jgi:hypothetical protein